MPEAYAIPASLLSEVPVVNIEEGQRVRSTGVPGGSYLMVRTSRELAVVPDDGIPTLVTPPAITSAPPTIGVALTSTGAVWSAPPEGFTLVSETRIIRVNTVIDEETELPVEIVTVLALSNQYTPQGSDFAATAEIHRESRAAFRNSDTQAVGAFTEWQRSVGRAVVYPQIEFSVQPTSAATAWTVGSLVTFTIGQAPGAIAVALFELDGVPVSGLTISGNNATWDSTGSSAGSLTFRTEASNPSTTRLSNLITVPLNASDAAATVTLLAGGETEIAYTATDGTITIAGVPWANGTYPVNPATVATTPIAIQTPVISKLNGAGPIVAGDTIGIEEPYAADGTRPGIFVFAPAAGEFTETWVWQREGVDIAGAPNTPTRTVLQADEDSDLRLVNRGVQGANTVNNASNELTVTAVSATSFVTRYDPLIRDVPDAEATEVFTAPCGFAANAGDAVVFEVYTIRGTGTTDGYTSLTIGGQSVTSRAQAAASTGHVGMFSVELTAPVTETSEVVLTMVAGNPANVVHILPSVGVGVEAVPSQLRDTAGTAASITQDIPVLENAFVFAVGASNAADIATVSGLDLTYGRSWTNRSNRSISGGFAGPVAAGTLTVTQTGATVISRRMAIIVLPPK